MQKSDFPIFDKQPELVYLDTAATALKPRTVIETVVDYYENYSANTHRGIYPMSEKATAKYEEAREKVAAFISSAPEQLIFTSGTTAGLNMVANSYADGLSPGDEIAVPISEHHANFLPWQRLAKQTRAKLVVIPINDLSPDKITLHISKRTKILAFAHASNVLGNINDVKAIAAAARSANPDLCIVVDGAQAVPHIKADVEDLDIDYYVFSGHKIYGPTGIGALWFSKRRSSELRPLIVGGGSISKVTSDSYSLLSGPQGFEAGTPAVAEAIGMGEAAEFTGKLSESNLSSYLFESLNDLDFVDIIGELDKPRVPLTSFNVRGVHPHDVAQFLADKNICVRAGHHCTMPLHESLGIPASVRASLGSYNDKGDIDALVESLRECYETLGSVNE